MNRIARLLTAAFLAAGIAACSKEAPPPPPKPAAPPAPAPTPAPAPVSVASATLGSAVGGDKKVTQAKESFAKKDTIYASIDTTGTGKANLKARWTFTTKGGKTVPVKEDTQTIDATGPATTEFHISKPDGWPAGSYQVEILQDDKVVQTKKFTVQ